MSDQAIPTRKTTRRRFHEAENERGEYKEFSPSLNEWNALEKAVGTKLSPDTQGEIATIVEDFIQKWADISSSPFADEVESELERIKFSAEKLSKYLDKDKPEGPACSAMLVARSGMLEYYSDDLDPFDDFYRKLRSIVGYCSEAIQKSRGYTEQVNEFDFWNKMIFDLLELFKLRHLPFRITGSPKPSPFVAFVRELHRIRPEDFPNRDEQSDDAFAKALRRAHRAILDKRQVAMHHECPEGTDVGALSVANVQSGRSDDGDDL